MKYAKIIASAVAAGAIALTAALTDNTITPGEWVSIGLAVLGALGVYAAPNTPSQDSRPVGEAYNRP
jgi:hypothetical protein